MRLTLGDTSYDLATRALVMGMLGADRSSPDELVALGADMVSLQVGAGDPVAVHAAVARLVGCAPVPVAVEAADAAGSAAAVEAGAAMVLGAPAAATVAAARAGAVVVLRAPGPGGLDTGPGGLDADRAELGRRAGEAEAAGLPPDRIVIDPSLAASPARLGGARRFADLGYPVLVRHSGAAEIALAVAGGCRLVQTRDVRTARRVCDVLAAILEARP